MKYLLDKEITCIPQPKHYVEVSRPDQTPFIVMEALPGLDLNQVIKQKYLTHYDPVIKDIMTPIDQLRFPPGDLREIMLQILEFVTKCLDINFVHRDLKLNNIFYNENTKKVTIVDFGISARNVDVDADFSREQWVGTERYKPFEFRDLGSRVKTRVNKTFGYGKSTWSMNESWCLGHIFFRLISLQYVFIQTLSNGRADPENKPVSLTNAYYKEHYINKRWDRINPETVPDSGLRHMINMLLNPTVKNRWNAHKALQYMLEHVTYGRR